MKTSDRGEHEPALHATASGLEAASALARRPTKGNARPPSSSATTRKCSSPGSTTRGANAPPRQGARAAPEGVPTVWLAHDPERFPSAVERTSRSSSAATRMAVRSRGPSSRGTSTRRSSRTATHRDLRGGDSTLYVHAASAPQDRRCASRRSFHRPDPPARRFVRRWRARRCSRETDEKRDNTPIDPTPRLAMPCTGDSTASLYGGTPMTSGAKLAVALAGLAALGVACGGSARARLDRSDSARPRRGDGRRSSRHRARRDGSGRHWRGRRQRE